MKTSSSYEKVVNLEEKLDALTDELDRVNTDHGICSEQINQLQEKCSQLERERKLWQWYFREFAKLRNPVRNRNFRNSTYLGTMSRSVSHSLTQ